MTIYYMESDPKSSYKKLLREKLFWLGPNT